MLVKTDQIHLGGINYFKDLVKIWPCSEQALLCTLSHLMGSHVKALHADKHIFIFKKKNACNAFCGELFLSPKV